MSDDDRDIDIESDEGDEDSDSRQPRQSSNQYLSQAEKRAHHNALERKRRDHIKDSFTSLRESVPALQGEKVVSRALILKKAADYIQFMRRKNSAHQQDIDDLKRQNSLLESQMEVRSRSVLSVVSRCKTVLALPTLYLHMQQVFCDNKVNCNYYICVSLTGICIFLTMA
ncbi:protein max isoform X2 [Zootermopsis nevadensis]|uniref:protein max isoform X2 n=1 Tax=Zootermopsis nevadensis TaxID=136037 RepID=UPI000B8E4944|nr:protein max isoform X2 [Zootermopsis nevadensis]